MAQARFMEVSRRVEGGLSEIQSEGLGRGWGGFMEGTGRCSGGVGEGSGVEVDSRRE